MISTCQRRGGRNSNAGRANTAYRQTNIQSNNGPPLCDKHQMECVLRVSRTANNNNRQFYKCPHPTDSSGCTFQWLDEPSTASRGELLLLRATGSAVVRYHVAIQVCSILCVTVDVVCHDLYVSRPHQFQLGSYVLEPTRTLFNCTLDHISLGARSYMMH